MLGGRCPHNNEGDFGDPLGYYTCTECPDFPECFPGLAQGEIDTRWRKEAK